MDTTTVPDGGPGMQYADPEGRPSPMVEAVMDLLDTTPMTKDDLRAMRRMLKEKLNEQRHPSWCTTGKGHPGRKCTGGGIPWCTGSGPDAIAGTVSLEGDEDEWAAWVEIYTDDPALNPFFPLDRFASQGVLLLLAHEPAGVAAALQQAVNVAVSAEEVVR